VHALTVSKANAAANARKHSRRRCVARMSAASDGPGRLATWEGVGCQPGTLGCLPDLGISFFGKFAPNDLILILLVDS
jgi:hypothetical protein